VQRAAYIARVCLLGTALCACGRVDYERLLATDAGTSPEVDGGAFDVGPGADAGFAPADASYPEDACTDPGCGDLRAYCSDLIEPTTNEYVSKHRCLQHLEDARAQCEGDPECVLVALDFEGGVNGTSACRGEGDAGLEQWSCRVTGEDHGLRVPIY
jgi:hypothetical protein